MRRWLPLAVVAALMVVPAAAAQAPGAETQTSLETDGGVVLAPGQAAAMNVEVRYRYQPIPWTSPTPTHLSVASGPSNLTAAFGTSTVYHEINEMQDEPLSVQETTLTVVAAEDAPETTTKVTLSGLSEANGPHASSQGEAEFIVKIDEAARDTSSTQSASLSAAPTVPVEALASLLAAGGLAVGLVRARRST